MAPVVEGKPDVTKIAEIRLEDMGREMRLQTIVFKTARDLYEQMRPAWKGNREYLLGQAIRLVEAFLLSDRVRSTPPLFAQEPLRRRILLILNMGRVVQHVFGAIGCENTERLVPVFDPERPIRSTSDMRTWYTARPCEPTRKSHINFCVFDSAWEASEAFALDRHEAVAAWVKNDHLGFEIVYLYRGAVRKYRPDFLVRLANGAMLVLEVKGRDTEEDQAKRAFLDEWARAVNAHGGFGMWAWDVSRGPGEIASILAKHL